MTSANNITDNLYFPDQMSQLTMQEVNKLRDQRGLGVKTGIRPIDGFLNPMRGGQLIPILGYTSNYKSGLMNIIARNAAAQCQVDEVVVIANWEDSVEDNGIWELAGATQISTTSIERGELSAKEVDKLTRAAIERLDVPIFWIGHADNDLRRRDRLTLDDVWLILTSLVDTHRRKPILLVLDYLQRIRINKQGHDHRVAMMQIVDRAKDLALAFNVPVLLGTQAGRKTLEQAAPPVPKMYHAQETSNIEQSATAFISTCFPSKTIPTGSLITHGGKQRIVTDNLLLVSLLKQKRGPAPIHFAFDVDFSSHTLHPVGTLNHPS